MYATTTTYSAVKFLWVGNITEQLARDYTPGPLRCYLGVSAI